MALYEPINEIVVRNGGPEPSDSVDAGNRPIGDAEPDDDPATRLRQAGCALHRATAALDGLAPLTLVPPWNGTRSPPNGPVPSSNAGIGLSSPLDDIWAAMGHIDHVNATIATASVGMSAESALCAAVVTDAVPPCAERFAASQSEEPLSDALQRIGGDLNSTVVRGMFEAALVLQGALQFDCDPEAVQRIESTVEVLHETIRQTRMMVFRLQTSDAQPRRPA